MGLIFWMSTDAFSAENTSLIIGPVLLFLMPRISSYDQNMIHGLIRKSAHVTEYFVLGLLLFRAFRSGSTESRSLRWSFFSALVVLLYAASDEFHQSFVPTRTASPIDVGIDTMGGIIAQAVSLLWHHRTRK
ncbi:MAG: VanZ family protein [Thermodesulfovibrionales bacterium]|jgi:VanZ family protein